MPASSMWSNTPNFMAGANGSLFPLQLDDLVGLGAAGRVDLDLRAFLLADQRAGERRGDGDLALFGVGLGFANDLPDGFLFGVLIDQCHGGAERDGIAGEPRYVDHFGARELVLEFGDAAFVERLGFLRRVIFGVLREIAVAARLADLLNYARTL